MTSTLVWVLITFGGYNGGNASYSPLHVSKESCEFMQKQVGRGQCVGMYAYTPQQQRPAPESK
jgi:hypothetical protein